MTAEFTAWEKLTGKLAPVAIPLLTSLAPVAVPIYGLKDKVFKGSESGAPLPSNTYKPIVVFSSRKVKDLAAYTAAYDAFATKAQAASDGIRMLFAFPDKAADAVLEVAWVDTPEDLPLLPNAVTNAYVDNAPDAYTVVWGEWTPALKDKIERASCGAKCYFNEGMGGYIKSPSEEEGASFKTGSDPMIWISKRKIKEGKMEQAKGSFQSGVNRMYKNAPTAIAIAEFEVPGEPDYLWSLRVFNDFDGFKRHFPVPSIILFRMVFNVVPTWEAFPIGYSFSSKAMIEGAISANPGNKAYAQFHFEGAERVGPKPDFAKGF